MLTDERLICLYSGSSDEPLTEFLPSAKGLRLGRPRARRGRREARRRRDDAILPEEEHWGATAAGRAVRL